MTTLNTNERIVTAYAQKASGPGWANSPLWVVIEDKATGAMREIAIQPKKFSREIDCLYEIADQVNSTLVAEATRILTTNPRRKCKTP